MKLVVFALGLCLQGCYAELTTYESPMAIGRIADAGTNQPIPGACIEAADKPETRTCVGSDGKFQLTSSLKRQRHFVIGPFDPAPPPGTALVSAAGYRSQTLRLGWGLNANLDVRLERAD